MAISIKRKRPENARHIDECAALLERTSVPEYRESRVARASMDENRIKRKVGD
jgi:hypothetical protein